MLFKPKHPECFIVDSSNLCLLLTGEMWDLEARILYP